MSISRKVTPQGRRQALARCRASGAVVPKPGMVTARMPVARQAEEVEGADGDEQGERRVEAAGEPEDHAAQARVLEALREAGGLDREDLEAALVERARVLGDEGMRIDGAARAGRARGAGIGATLTRR